MIKVTEDMTLATKAAAWLFMVVGMSNDGIRRPAVCVDTLDYDGAETHQDSIEGEITRHYYDCPSCGHPISTWMDCPECLWYDEDVWARTLTEEGGST